MNVTEIKQEIDNKFKSFLKYKILELYISISIYVIKSIFNEMKGDEQIFNEKTSL